MGSLGPYRASLIALLVLATLALLVACGGGAAGGSGEAENTGGTGNSEGAAGTTSTGEGTSGEVALTPTEATVGENEETAMPANNRQEDPAQDPPENPPEGVRTYPATTNRNVEGQIAYEK